MFHNPEIYKTALDNLPLGVYMVDAEMRIVFWSQGAERISGYLAQDVLGRHCREKLLVDLDESNPVACGGVCQLKESMRDGKFHEAHVLLRHREGHLIPVHARATPLRNDSNKVIGATECFEERRFNIAPDRREKQKNPAGGIDAPTGLLDIATTRLRVQESVAEFIEHHLPFCILIAEIDGLAGFKSIHGKDAVEAARIVVGHTLSNALRPTDVVGSWDENRFLAIVKDCNSAAAKSVAERVRKIESYSEVEWWGDELAITVSIGGTVVRHEDKVDSLVGRAQAALCQSVKQGGNRVAVFPEDQIGGSKA
jgi:PAS domain S-box-containing protein/diguanylate cyclase (GGDEF)-like protein